MEGMQEGKKEREGSWGKERRWQAEDGGRPGRGLVASHGAPLPSGPLSQHTHLYLPKPVPARPLQNLLQNEDLASPSPHWSQPIHRHP